MTAELPTAVAQPALPQDPLRVACPTCGAAVGAACRSLASLTEAVLTIEHRARLAEALR